jgi:hypothetical protein
MSYIKEYLDNKIVGIELEKELHRLVEQYNKKYDSYLIIYAAAFSKPIPDISLSMEDYYIISDILRNIDSIKNIDFYLETPGGSGEAAEEIIRYIRNSYPDATLSFIISGEAKSAGTILALGGDEIFMTKSGSLGPIDAQMKIGRMVVSAYDYNQWIEEKKEEAEKTNTLNPFDAVLIAQISPGEIKAVHNNLCFAKDLVKDWLPRYKFRNWNRTESQNKEVTEKMKQQRAEEIAEELVNHEKWRTHRRSFKIEDLRERLKLKIHCIDDDPEKAEIIYRIQSVLILLFSSSSNYKVFKTLDTKLFRSAVSQSDVKQQIPKKILKSPKFVELEIQCPECGTKHALYAKLHEDLSVDKDFKKRGLLPFPKSGKLQCKQCGFTIDLTGLKTEIEGKTGKKIVYTGGKDEEA